MNLFPLILVAYTDLRQQISDSHLPMLYGLLLKALNVEGPLVAQLTNLILMMSGTVDRPVAVRDHSTRGGSAGRMVPCVCCFHANHIQPFGCIQFA